MKLTLSAMAVLALALVCTPVQAQTSAEQAGQQACGNDAFTLCGDAIPDRGRIEACLRRNFSRVSKPCRTYMASFGKTHRAVNAERHHYRRSHADGHHHTHHHKTKHHSTQDHHSSR